MQIVFGHPHPMYSISANETNIVIHSLHSQKINEQYVNENLVLNGCDITEVRQDESYLRIMETYITMKHNCGKPEIKKNTLFKDYWKKVPLSVKAEGFQQTSNSTEDKESIAMQHSFFKLTGNFFIDIIMIFLLGIVSLIVGDLFNFILPVSIADKTKINKNFIYYSITIHLISTYVFIFFSLTYLSSFLSSHIWFILLVIGVFLLLENYLKTKHYSPYLIATIPCPATIFIVTVFLKGEFFLATIAPLIVIASEFLILIIIKKYIKIKKDYSKLLPYLFIILGILLFGFYHFSSSFNIESNQLNGASTFDSGRELCQFNEDTLGDYFMNLELTLRTSKTCDEVINYINQHECTDNATINTNEDRFFFNASWINGKKISYSYEKNSLVHLDCSVIDS
jgi:hypothetical protein